jgi:hypothetical protein
MTKLRFQGILRGATIFLGVITTLTSVSLTSRWNAWVLASGSRYLVAGVDTFAGT